MAYNLKDIIEYTVALVSSFAQKCNLNERQAFHYISFHKGIGFIEENYGVIHTLDFDEAVESLRLFCRRMGGKL